MVEAPAYPDLYADRDDLNHLERLADCKPFAENEDDLKEKWLENYGLRDVTFVAVPDPLLKRNDDLNYDYDPRTS